MENSSEEIKKILIIRITKSPYKADNNLPWDFESDAFSKWVWEVYMDGYKKNIPCPSILEAIQYLTSKGFEVRTLKRDACLEQHMFTD